ENTPSSRGLDEDRLRPASPVEHAEPRGTTQSPEHREWRDQDGGHRHLGQVTWRMRCARQALGAKSGSQRGPDDATHGGSGQPGNPRDDRRVEHAGQWRPNERTIPFGMFFVEQGVKRCLRLLMQTDPPGRWPNRMHDDRVRRMHDSVPSVQEAKIEVAVLPPRHRERLIEPTERYEHATAHKTVRGDEHGMFEPRGVALIVARPLTDGHAHIAPCRAGTARVYGGNPIRHPT